MTVGLMPSQAASAYGGCQCAGCVLAVWWGALGWLAAGCNPIAAEVTAVIHQALMPYNASTLCRQYAVPNNMLNQQIQDINRQEATVSVAMLNSCMSGVPVIVFYS
jgi:hypothetical protein